MPTSKHLRIVAILSASFVSSGLTPATGQQPSATGETKLSDLPNCRRAVSGRVVIARFISSVARACKGNNQSDTRCGLGQGRPAQGDLVFPSFALQSTLESFG